MFPSIILSFLALAFPASTASARPQIPLSQNKAPFPATWDLFSSSFQQPKPPKIHSEFKSHWKQHAWSPDFSHISAGYAYVSPSNAKVRVDQAFDSNFASSLFDYSNISSDGLVSNTLYTLTPSIASAPDIFRDYVNPTFPLFVDSVLVDGSAVFSGVVTDAFVGWVSSWSIMYQDRLPVTVFLDAENTLVGFDSFDTSSRMRIVNRFFNIVTGKIDSKFFDFPK